MSQRTIPSYGLFLPNTDHLPRDDCFGRHTKFPQNFLQDIDLVFKPVQIKSFSTQRTIWNIPTLQGTHCRQSTQCSSVISGPSGRPPADIVGSNPAGGMDVFCDCCQVEVSAKADHSSRGDLLTVVRRFAWSRNIMNEEATACFWPQRQKEKNPRWFNR
jgi:hypothetical protein